MAHAGSITTALASVATALALVIEHGAAAPRAAAGELTVPSGGSPELRGAPHDVIVVPPAPQERTVISSLPPVSASAPRSLPSDVTRAIVQRAREEVTSNVRYDASYRILPSYPNGDVPSDRGACTDVVIRALRAVGVDLQVLVYEDVLSHPSVYGFEPNPSIDHRRVWTLYAFFERRAVSLSTDVRRDTTSFQPGDIVFFAYRRCSPRSPCVPEHVGIVSDRVGSRGLPLVLQNGGPRATEADSLDRGAVIGHFRLYPGER